LKKHQKKLHLKKRAEIPKMKAGEEGTGLVYDIRETSREEGSYGQDH